jgi:uncharacterized protein
MMLERVFALLGAAFEGGQLMVQRVLLALLLVAGPLAATGWAQVTFPNRPPSGGVIVSDEIGLITVENRQEIERIGNALFKDRGYPMCVVTIRALAAHRATGYTIDRYAVELLKAWNLEAAHKSHGLLLLVSEDDRLARIQLGTAWGAAHDGRASEVMDTLILPAFKRGEMSKGILDGVRGFDAMGRGLALPTPPMPWWLIPAVAAGGLVLVGGIISFSRSGRTGWAWAIGGFVGAMLLARLIGMIRGGGDDSTADESGVTGKW